MKGRSRALVDFRHVLREGGSGGCPVQLLSSSGPVFADAVRRASWGMTKSVACPHDLAINYRPCHGSGHVRMC